MVFDVLKHVVDEFAHGKRTAVAKLGSFRPAVASAFLI
jgi:hypothetical protein